MHMPRGFYFASAVPILVALLLPYPAAAAWPSDPLVNVPICTASGNQTIPTIVSDCAGGAIVFWRDSRSGNDDIYAQRISASGAAQWTADGVALCTDTSKQTPRRIISDGTGGAIVTWLDYRNGDSDIYSQRISADGMVQWAVNGVALCAAAGQQMYGDIDSDGAGGAVVTWDDYRNGNLDIYAQRISADGMVQWTADGVAICTATGNDSGSTITSDSAGGAIVSWSGTRTDGTHYIAAQSISATGTVRWRVNGVALGGTGSGPRCVSDGAGGAAVTWMGDRNGYSNIYYQRISADGELWMATGYALWPMNDDQFVPAIASDGAGGATVTWYSGYTNRTYARRMSVSNAGPPVALCAAAGGQLSPAIASDGAGGAIVTWVDYRSDYNEDIYAQRISVTDLLQWTINGVALCTAASYQGNPSIAPDGAGGAIVVWQDSRNGGGTNSDIYAQRVDATGQLGGTPQAVYLAQFWAARHGQQAMVHWAISHPRDHAGFYLWRQEAGSDRVRLSQTLLSGQEAYDFTDPAPPVGAADYWLQEMTTDGSANWYGPAHLNAATVPSALRLYSATPNPFNPRTTIRFDLPGAGPVRLAIYDLAGRLVRVLVEGEISAGSHEAVWDGRDSTGRSAPSGSYLARLVAGGKVEGVRLSLVR
jgi:hypothetical protein